MHEPPISGLVRIGGQNPQAAFSTGHVPPPIGALPFAGKVKVHEKPSEASSAILKNNSVLSKFLKSQKIFQAVWSTMNGSVMPEWVSYGVLHDMEGPHVADLSSRAPCLQVCYWWTLFRRPHICYFHTFGKICCRWLHFPNIHSPS